MTKALAGGSYDAAAALNAVSKTDKTGPCFHPSLLGAHGV